ncbi:HET-domain-containing protein [Echria macrotheca]|uniref:HET-domain-containing protein n=1 Tax=Echria macrotheca TaxID=438768 RepID=A0AAJ0BFS2_9PEZI|nr:HET-domain-containing protein [Echria macrotheca]
MRLLHTRTLQLENFLGTVPPYAILSHTWEKEEVTLEDMKPGGRPKEMQGYHKLKRSARLARHEGYEYIWIDTCCIDKSSSAELSEAINSMFQWYKESAICYAYLADVADINDIDSQESCFRKSRWFTRGWTLQEMIAPKEVVFLGNSWSRLGTRLSLANTIESVTKVPETILMGKRFDGTSAAARMSWASERITTRPEDMAYCLLGLFDVNMPLLYGEGQEKAFMRLQQEFLKASDDETLFAWRVDSEEVAAKPCWGLLAASPRYFKRANELQEPRSKTRIVNHPTEVTNRGLRVELSLDPMPGDASGSIFLAVLQCAYYDNNYRESFIAIVLQRLSSFEQQYTRIVPDIILHADVGFIELPINSLSPVSREWYQRSGLLYGDTVRVRASHADPQGQLIFVRPVPRVAELAAGIYFYPETQLRVAVEGTILVTVSWLQEPWEKWGDPGNMASFYYMVYFHHALAHLGILPLELAVKNLQGRKALGCLKLSLTKTNKDGVRAWETSTYLVVGMEAIPPNPFGTPAGYTRPWYSFANGVDGNAIMKRFTDSDSCEPTPLFALPDWLLLEAEFGVGKRFSRVCHRLDLFITKPCV